MKKFRHLNIIKKYSKSYIFSRKVKGNIVGGRPSYTEKKISCNVAVVEIKETELQDFSGFKLGDVKVYAIKGQVEMAMQNDRFETEGNKYKLKETRNNFLYPDYLFYVGVLEVNSGS